jgi:hypothetical protein
VPGNEDGSCHGSLDLLNDAPFSTCEGLLNFEQFFSFQLAPASFKEHDAGILDPCVNGEPILRKAE